MFNLKQQFSCSSLVMLISLESAQFLSKIHGALGYILSVCPLFYKFMALRLHILALVISVSVCVYEFWGCGIINLCLLGVLMCVLNACSFCLVFVVFMIYSQRHQMVLEYVGGGIGMIGEKRSRRKALVN